MRDGLSAHSMIPTLSGCSRDCFTCFHIVTAPRMNTRVCSALRPATPSSPPCTWSVALAPGQQTPLTAAPCSITAWLTGPCLLMTFLFIVRFHALDCEFRGLGISFSNLRDRDASGARQAFRKYFRTNTLVTFVLVFHQKLAFRKCYRTHPLGRKLLRWELAFIGPCGHRV